MVVRNWLFRNTFRSTYKHPHSCYRGPMPSLKNFKNKTLFCLISPVQQTPITYYRLFPQHYINTILLL